MPEIWPTILRPRSILFEPQFNNRSGGMSISGVEQVVSSSAGRWRAVYGGIAVRNREHVKAFRALSVQLEGRLGTVVLPLCDKARAPWPSAGGKEVKGYGKIPHSDKALFYDKSGYYQPVITAHVAAGALLGATTIFLAVTYGGFLEPGQHFSLGNRLYRIQRVMGAAGPIFELRICPPLRAAATFNDLAEFNRPVCLMKLATDDAMDLDLDLNRLGSPTVNFIEAP